MDSLWWTPASEQGFVAAAASLLGLAAAVLYLYYQINVAPMDRRRSLMDVGFKSVRGLNGNTDSDSYLRRHMRSRKLGESLKPPYPNGWTVVAESREVHCT